MAKGKIMNRTVRRTENMTVNISENRSDNRSENRAADRPANRQDDKKKNKARGAALYLMTAILCVSLAGCGSKMKESGGSESGNNTGSSMTEASQSGGGDGNTGGDTIKLPEISEAYTRVPVSGIEGSVTGITDAGEGSILLAVNKYSASPDGGEGESATVYYRIDAVSGEILSEGSPEYYYEKLVGSGENGVTITFDSATSTLRYYDKDMSLMDSKETGAEKVCYSRASDSVYYMSGSRLYKVKTGGDPQIILDDMLNVEIDDCGFSTGNLLMSEPSEDDQDLSTGFIYKEPEQEIVAGKDNYSGRTMLCRDSYLTYANSRSIGEADDKSFIMYIDCIKDEGQIRSFRLLPDDDFMLYGGDGSEYAVISTFSPEGFVKGLYMLDTVSGLTGDLSALLSDDLAIELFYVNSIGCWVLSRSSFTGDLPAELYLLHPENMTFTENIPLSDSTEYISGESEKKYRSGAAVEEVRAKAAAMEEKYNIRILMGDEVLNCPLTYTVISTENEEYLPEGTDQIAELNTALDTLDSALSYYPDSFFERFVSYGDRGGLRFCFARSFINEEGGFTPGGVQNCTGVWFNIFLDISLLSGETIHHELWHAVENRIIMTDRDAFDGWDELLPDDFIYQNDKDSFGDTEYRKYVIPEADDPYFIMTYSTINEREDRATTVEFLFYDEFYGIEEDPREYAYSHPHIKAKLDYLGERVKEVFGYIYWEK